MRSAELARDGERAAEIRRLALFEDRYGVGAYERLIRWLSQPCVSFADIAQHFGVTRERVRQWHQAFRPGAPGGHARQRACADQRQRARLLADPVFRAFHDNARRRFARDALRPVRTRDGYRATCAMLDGHLVALLPRLRRYRGSAAFVYVQLTSSEFLFLPARRVPSRPGETTDLAALEPFRNTFDALDAVRPRAADRAS